MKLIPLLMILTGVLLIYSAKKGKDPRNVIYEALNIKRRVSGTVTTNPETGRRSGGGTFGGADYPTTTPGTTTVSV